jgi:hypothetical protein
MPEENMPVRSFPTGRGEIFIAMNSHKNYYAFVSSDFHTSGRE